MTGITPWGWSMKSWIAVSWECIFKTDRPVSECLYNINEPIDLYWLAFSTAVLHIFSPSFFATTYRSYAYLLHPSNFSFFNSFARSPAFVIPQAMHTISCMKTDTSLAHVKCSPWYTTQCDHKKTTKNEKMKRKKAEILFQKFHEYCH